MLPVPPRLMGPVPIVVFVMFRSPVPATFSVLAPRSRLLKGFRKNPPAAAVVHVCDAAKVNGKKLLIVDPDTCVMPPAPRATLLPPRENVFPVASNVKELKPVPAAKSFVVGLTFVALSKIKSSFATGAVPPQFDAFDQRPSVVPVQWRDASGAVARLRVPIRIAARMRMRVFRRS